MIKMSDILDKINIYDVIFVVTVLVSFLISYKNGFLYSIVSLFKVIGSAIGAGYISKKYALYVYEKFFKDALVSKVAQKLADFRDGIINSFGQDVLGKAISDYLNKTALGSDLDQISETIVNESVQNTVVSGFQIILFIIVNARSIPCDLKNRTNERSLGGAITPFYSVSPNKAPQCGALLYVAISY